MNNDCCCASNGTRVLWHVSLFISFTKWLYPFMLNQISDDIKDAMRARDKVRLRTLRSLRAALQNKQIDGRESADDKTALSEQAVLAVIRKEAKQRKDSIEQFEAGGRDDLVQKEKEELEILESYLPDPLTDEELESTIDTIIDDVGASSMADMGAVMGRAMGQLRGRVDGGRVQQAVKSKLMG